jgi:hypothetical protein
MRFRDLNEQVGERPASEIFRDSQIEPLKISMTPSIARDRTSITPEDDTMELVGSYVRSVSYITGCYRQK